MIAAKSSAKLLNAAVSSESLGFVKLGHMNAHWLEIRDACSRPDDVTRVSVSNEAYPRFAMNLLACMRTGEPIGGCFKPLFSSRSYRVKQICKGLSVRFQPHRVNARS